MPPRIFRIRKKCYGSVHVLRQGDASKVLWKRSLSVLLDRSVYSEKWFQYMEHRPKYEFIMFQPVVADAAPIFRTSLPCHSNPQSISHSSGRNLSYAASHFQNPEKVLWKCVCVCLARNLPAKLYIFKRGSPIGVSNWDSNWD